VNSQQIIEQNDPTSELQTAGDRKGILRKHQSVCCSRIRPWLPRALWRISRVLG